MRPRGTQVRTASRWLAALAVTVCAVLATAAVQHPSAARASAAAQHPSSARGAATKTVSYRGYRLTVPRSWPVYRISAASSVCVRFNRHAIYLGRPGSHQLCPPQQIGRTAAILIQPLAGSSAAGTGAADLSGTVTQIIDRRHGIVITATWQPGKTAAIRTALGLGTLHTTTPHPRAATIATTQASANTSLRSAATLATRMTPRMATAGEVYSGLGFDTCATPSRSVMGAWSRSSYRAVGVYIGGADMSCLQPNLSSSWVDAESSAGWHMIPIYVGLQAPTNSCGCAAMSTRDAARQGAEAASNAVAEARAVGFGTGNPIYDDMEQYTPGRTNTPAVLAYLQAWTQTLHSHGYRSGVYSGDYAAIGDLDAKIGRGYAEPDDIWIANWNGRANVVDGTASSRQWPDGRRLHQYRGGFDATYGGVTMNIDADALDGQTGAAGSATPGTNPNGYLMYSAYGNIYGSPGMGLYGSPNSTHVGLTDMVGLASTANHRGYWMTTATGAVYAFGNATREPAATFRNRVVGIASDPDGNGYWLVTAEGNVHTSGTAFYGSPAARGIDLSNVVGIAATIDGRGYWVVTSTGQVYAFGDAHNHAAIRPAHPIVGIGANRGGGGYWLVTAAGNVYNSGTNWYGSPVGSRVSVDNIAGIVPTSDGKGYWLIMSNGHVDNYGDAARESAAAIAHPIIGATG